MKLIYITFIISMFIPTLYGIKTEKSTPLMKDINKTLAKMNKIMTTLNDIENLYIPIDEIKGEFQTIEKKLGPIGSKYYPINQTIKKNQLLHKQGKFTNPLSQKERSGVKKIIDLYKDIKTKYESVYENLEFILKKDAK